eukprot:COSAG02_NODE_1175_length_14063_cov_24.197794_5_plen_78_part_00
MVTAHSERTCSLVAAEHRRTMGTADSSGFDFNPDADRRRELCQQAALRRMLGQQRRQPRVVCVGCKVNRHTLQQWHE